MKRSPILLFAAILGATAASASDFDYTVTSSKSVDATVEAVTAAAQADGFKVPGVHTLPAPDPYVLVEVCDPAEAKKFFAVDLKLGLLLPCGKIAVYKDAKDAGKTKISMLLPSTLTKVHPAKEVAAMAQVLDPRLRKIVEAAK
jgi:uncharacterized protein (DUF302 family)